MQCLAQGFLVQTTTLTVNEDKTWLVLHGTNAFLIPLSMLLYKRYHYRLQDEVVNDDRELQLAEEYEGEES